MATNTYKDNVDHDDNDAGDTSDAEWSDVTSWTETLSSTDDLPDNAPDSAPDSAPGSAPGSAPDSVFIAPESAPDAFDHVEGAWGYTEDVSASESVPSWRSDHQRGAAVLGTLRRDADSLASMLGLPRSKKPDVTPQIPEHRNGNPTNKSAEFVKKCVQYGYDWGLRSIRDRVDTDDSSPSSKPQTSGVSLRTDLLVNLAKCFDKGTSSDMRGSIASCSSEVGNVEGQTPAANFNETCSSGADSMLEDFPSRLRKSEFKYEPGTVGFNLSPLDRTKMDIVLGDMTRVCTDIAGQSSEISSQSAHHQALLIDTDILDSGNCSEIEEASLQIKPVMSSRTNEMGQPGVISGLGELGNLWKFDNLFDYYRSGLPMPSETVWPSLQINHIPQELMPVEQAIRITYANPSYPERTWKYEHEAEKESSLDSDVPLQKSSPVNIFNVETTAKTGINSNTIFLDQEPKTYDFDYLQYIQETAWVLDENIMVDCLLDLQKMVLREFREELENDCFLPQYSEFEHESLDVRPKTSYVWRASSGEGVCTDVLTTVL